MILTPTGGDVYDVTIQCLEKIEIKGLHFDDFTEADSREWVRLGIGRLNGLCPCGKLHRIGVVRMVSS